MITKHLNRSELILALKADGVFHERPDIAHHTLTGVPFISKDVTYVLAGSEASTRALARSAGRASAPTERRAISDEEADRRVAEFEARRNAQTAPIASPTPAPSSPVTETRRTEPVSVERGSLDFLAEVTRRVSLTEEQRREEDDEAIMRGALDHSPLSAPVIETRGASPDDASASFIELCMRGVNDSESAAERGSRDPSDELVRLAFQNVPDFDGPDAA